MDIYIKLKKRRKEEFQFFMHDFIDACCKAGIKSKPDLFPSYRWHIRALLRDIWIMLYCCVHFLFKFKPLKRKDNLIVAANGNSLKDALFPYYFRYNIVPMLWDCWPSYWSRMTADFKLFDIQNVFVTSRQVADKINKETNVRAIWIPEGINASLYKKGNNLRSREIDIIEMGRRMSQYHQILVEMLKKGKINKLINSNIHADGTLNDKHVFYTNEELRGLMSNSKIMICFPQCDTNPLRAGDIETLTQRYWEAMLSRCLIIGRAPKELLDVVGYNPVVNVDWNNPEVQLVDILNNIQSYQNLVDRNYKVAKNNADWSFRMETIKKSLL